MMNKNEFSKLIQFSIVGSIGVIVDLGGTWFFKEKLMISPYVASCLGFTLAVLNNYILNKYWTFQDKSELSFYQFLGFLFVSVGGLLLNTLCVKLMYDGLDLNFYLSKVLAIGIVVPWNYFANSRFVFRNKAKLN